MPADTLLDRKMPQWHFREYHQALAPMDPARAYEAFQNIDFRESRLVGPLFRLRELPFRLRNRDFRSPGFGYTFAHLLQLGFMDLGQDPPREFVIGLAGRFWGLNPDIVDLTSDRFAGFRREGYAKVATNFLVTRRGSGFCLLSTETRILCLGPKALSSFRRYWTLIRPFSGLIRREWLRLAVRLATKASIFD